MSRRNRKSVATAQATLPAKQTENLAITGRTSVTSVHMGPLPPPDVFAGYEQVCPGAAERILSMAEQQAKHRQDLEKIALKSQSRNSLIGLMSGTFLGLTGIGASTYIATMGYSLVGLAGVVFSLATLAGVFVYGKYSNKQEMLEKQKMMNGDNEESIS